MCVYCIVLVVRVYCIVLVLVVQERVHQSLIALWSPQRICALLSPAMQSSICSTPSTRSSRALQPSPKRPSDNFHLITQPVSKTSLTYTPVSFFFFLLLLLLLYFLSFPPGSVVPQMSPASSSQQPPPGPPISSNRPINNSLTSPLSQISPESSNSLPPEEYDYEALPQNTSLTANLLAGAAAGVMVCFLSFIYLLLLLTSPPPRNTPSCTPSTPSKYVAFLFSFFPR